MGCLQFPIVCAAPLSKEIMDRFLEESGADEDHRDFSFVDSIDDYYIDEPSERPIEEDSDPNSPFIGKTPQECHQMLLKLRKDTGSEIVPSMFIIMDERSTQDDTVLLVLAAMNDDGEEVVSDSCTIRATFQASATAITLYHTGHSSVPEDAERAQREDDGVYRGMWSKFA